MTTEQRNFILGLDIGIASVGYGIVDSDTKEIIDAGVRLFPEGKSDENNGRRTKRGSRRLSRRRKHRLLRVKYLLEKYGFETKNMEDTNPYEIRVRGLYEKLTDRELVIALNHLSKRRGIHNVDVSDDDGSDSELSTKEQINRNNKLLKDKYICEIQLDRLKENGIIRNHTNRFKTSDYINEARKILETQSKYNEKIDENFISEYIKLIETRRTYYEGPGKGSPYGWEEDVKKWYVSMMGRCTYYPEELRSVKYSYSASLFNILNELNNLVIARDENSKLTKEEKELLIEKVFKVVKTKPSLQKIAKALDVKPEDIKGYRIDKSDKPEFSTIKIYHDIKAAVNNKEVTEDEQLLDEIAEILTIWQSEEDIIDELSKLNATLSESDILKISKLKGYTGTHALSLKLIKEINHELWETKKNHMGIISSMKLRPRNMDFKGLNKIPVDFVDEWILSPVVKRSLVQAIKVVNEVFKQYGTPKDIIIELAREKNSDDKKKFIQKLQKENEKLNKEVREILNLHKRGDKGLFEKLKLWHLQDGFCMYSAQQIKIQDLITNSENYEIDHIIPRSVSYDDSMNNKVLVKLEENQKKSKQTPFQYLSSGVGEITYPEYKKHVLSLAKDKKRITKKKLGYLLEERDIKKFDVQKEFINRNLVDTRYATREIMNLLKLYFKDNNIETKVKSINGGFTYFLRGIWGFDKDRNEGYKHHAEDALIIAMADYIFENRDIFKNENLLMKNNQAVDLETGEILQEEDFKAKFFENNMYKNINAIKEYQNFKYSKRVDKKPNRELMNETIYSSRKIDGDEYIIRKIKNLYDPKNKDLKKKYLKDETTFLMYEHDKQTFENLRMIMERYKEADNPLAKYHEETGEYLRKYSKNGNGPIVKSIKYKHTKLGSHHEITHKYNKSKNKVFTLSFNPFRIDIYKENDKYKFINVRYVDIIDNGHEYAIDSKLYNERKLEKKISGNAKFIGSFFKYDLIKIDGELTSIIGVFSDAGNLSEVDLVEQSYKEFADINGLRKRKYMSIGSKHEILKYTTDILGNLYPVKNEKLKMKFPKSKGK